MDRIIKMIETINQWTGKVCSYLVYAGMAVLVYEVFARYALQTSELWTHGLAQRFFSVYYLMAGGFVLLYKGHINMDLIYNKTSHRKRVVLNLVSSILIIFTGIIFVWKGGEFAYNSLVILERDNSAWNAPIYPVKVFMPIAGILLTLQALADFYKNIESLMGKKNYGS